MDLGFHSGLLAVQFGAYPEYVEMTDTPADAQTHSLEVQPGDLIVMGNGTSDHQPG